MSRINRRAFMKQSLAVAGATFVVGRAGRPVLGANARINLALVGCGGRSGNHLSEYLKMKDVAVTWCADPDKGRAEGKAKAAGGATAVQDVRKALEDKELNGVSIASCNHWHTLLTIWAIQAGKDVYVEKPATHTVHEGRVCTDMIAKSDRIVQTGTQRRSEARWAKMVEVTRSGALGKLLVSHGFASKTRNSIGIKEFTDPPANLDWDLWVGPAPMQKHHANLAHYNWHWFWDFGNGEIGNQGVHQTDVARWAIPGATHPDFVVSLGGRIGYQDQGQTPNTQLTIYQYGDTMLFFEVCGLVGGPSKDKDGAVSRVSNDFVYEAGTVVDATKFTPKDSGKAAEMPKVEGKVRPNGPFGNFIDCMRSRKKEDLNAPFDEGHYSAAICHLGNISYRLGKPAKWADLKKPFDDAYANSRWDAIAEHLVKNRGLNLAEWTCTVGLPLKFDPKTEKFIDAPPEATAMLTRPARKPYDVPEKA
jgi:predicted dehydrogenase